VKALNDYRSGAPKNDPGEACNFVLVSSFIYKCN
jgi:hypothetical protein